MMKAILVTVVVFGCGSVKNSTIDAASIDGQPIDAAVDAPIDADLSPHLVFVTSTVHSCVLGGLTGADAICQARAQGANLMGTYKAWLADTNLSPATRMTHHLGPYQLVSGTVIAQGWTDLTDGTLAAKIDRTETGVQLGGVGCDANLATCHFICAGGEVWSNVDAAGNRRVIADCNGWTTTGNATAGNDGKTNAMWTAGDCTPIASGSTLPIFCVQQ